MKVRAKFRVDSIEQRMGTKSVTDSEGKVKYESCLVGTVKMSPVYSTDPGSENAKFWSASPSGSIELGCANLEALKEFEVDKEYYIDFTLAPPTEAD